jgi:hypothetical protein
MHVHVTDQTADVSLRSTHDARHHEPKMLIDTVRREVGRQRTSRACRIVRIPSMRSHFMGLSAQPEGLGLRHTNERPGRRIQVGTIECIYQGLNAVGQIVGRRTSVVIRWRHVARRHFRRSHNCGGPALDLAHVNGQFPQVPIGTTGYPQLVRMGSNRGHHGGGLVDDVLSIVDCHGNDGSLFS